MGNNYTYASIVPLIGGETIAMQNVFGKRPEYMLSYKAFGANDSQLREYYNNEVPYHVIDEDQTAPGSLKNVDVVNTVCPCAGLSMLNTRANSDAAANNWMFESAEYVLENIKPKVFWGENAPGLYGNMGKPVVEKLRKIADKFGYTFLLYKTKSKLHGIGQIRNRSFYFFWKDTVTPLMDYYDREMQTIEDIIRNAYVSDDDPMNALVNDKKPSEDPWYRFVLEHIEGGISHQEFYKKLSKSTNPISYMESVRGLQGYMEAAQWFKENGLEREAEKAERMYKKLKSGGSIMKRATELGKGSTSAFVGHFATSLAHPDEDRYISIREALAIMKMPSDFQLQGGRKNINMICQNVPVCTAQDMAEGVLKYLEGASEVLNTNFVKQNNTNRTIEYMDTQSTLDKFFD